MRDALMRRAIGWAACLVVPVLLFVEICEKNIGKKISRDSTIAWESYCPVACVREKDDGSAHRDRRSVPREVPRTEVSVAEVLHAPNDVPVVANNLEAIAAERSQRMDDLLNQNPMPANYGQVMIDLFRAKALDIYTRDFAVQHIGLYAEALQRQGRYDPSSSEARLLRQALEEAAQEARTIVAAAAFRALSDLAAFDPNVDLKRLGSRLLSCVSDASASQAARVMAIQLCGERKVASSRGLLKRLADDPKLNAVVRKSASRSLLSLETPEER